MNAFHDACSVEAKGRIALLPFLSERSDGKFVLLDKGPIARALQETTGDAIFTAIDGSARSVELKTENRFTGNLFLESWSNRNLSDASRRAQFGINPGWLHKLNSDLLFYYFLEGDRLYVFELMRLQRWAFVEPGTNGNPGRLWDFPEREQGKRQQANDTWGRLVPLRVVRDEVGYRFFNPSQLFLPTLAEVAL